MPISSLYELQMESEPLQWLCGCLGIARWIWLTIERLVVGAPADSLSMQSADTAVEKDSGLGCPFLGNCYAWAKPKRNADVVGYGTHIHTHTYICISICLICMHTYSGAIVGCKRYRASEVVLGPGELGRRRTLGGLGQQWSRQSTDKGHTGQRTSCVPLQCTHTTAFIFHNPHAHLKWQSNWNCKWLQQTTTRTQAQTTHGSKINLYIIVGANCGARAWAMASRGRWRAVGGGQAWVLARRGRAGQALQLLYTCMIYACECFQPTDNAYVSASSASQVGCLVDSFNLQ